MLRYASRRTSQAVLVVLAAFSASFVVLYLLPGDPVLAMVAGGETNTVSAADVEAIRAEYGFDRPLHEQYLGQLVAAVQGDLGRSLNTGRPVTEMIATAVPETLKLVVLALSLALVLGVGAALLATYTQSRPLRQFLLSLPAIGIALPSFWVGLMLVQLMSFQFRLLPALGNKGFDSLVLPAVTLSLPAAAVVAQVLAKGMSSTLAAPYIETARAKGVSRPRIHLSHALRNAAIPTLTICGVLVGNLIAGSVIVETVFSRAGLGRLTVTAVLAHDIPLVQGVVVFGALVFVLVNLMVDLSYPLIDPRITTGSAMKG